MTVRTAMRPEAVAKERALAAQRYRRQNIAIAILAAGGLAAFLGFANYFGGAEAVLGALLLYAISLPITGVILWLGSVLWWGVDCTLVAHALRVAALNAVALAALIVCEGVGMPWFGKMALVGGLMVLILRTVFEMESQESIVAAIILYFTPVLVAIVLLIL